MGGGGGGAEERERETQRMSKITQPSNNTTFLFLLPSLTFCVFVGSLQLQEHHPQSHSVSYRFTFIYKPFME